GVSPSTRLTQRVRGYYPCRGTHSHPSETWQIYLTEEPPCQQPRSVHTPDVIAHQARPDVRVHMQVDDIALAKNRGGFARNAKSFLAIFYAFAHSWPPHRIRWRSGTREAPYANPWRALQALGHAVQVDFSESVANQRTAIGFSKTARLQGL